jgi:rhamnogalacturonyl hydrolase YesR
MNLKMNHNEYYKIKDWILNSGIQNYHSESQKFDNDFGGFNSWYNLSEGSYPYIYSEITGYGITTLLSMYSRTKDDEVLARANSAANWVVDYAMDDGGGIRARKFYKKDGSDDNYSFSKGNLYTFDTGMVLFGLTSLYCITKDEKLLKASIKIADFLIDRQKMNGELFAFINPITGIIGDNDDKWSNQSGAFHGKVAMGLHKVYEITKNNKYRTASIELIKSVYHFQNDEGRFITQRKDGSTLQHPHCYAAEGLIYMGLKTEDSALIDRGIRAIKWSMNSQLDNGGIPQIYHPDSGFINYERSDILSQVLRLAVFINKNIRKEFDNTSINRLKNRLSEFINESGVQKGGIFYGYESNGKKYTDLNAWCSMFALNAFEFYYSDNIGIDHLI